MNIFVLSNNPQLAARYHCDKHVVKMIVESCQLLSTSVHYHGFNGPDVYKPTHANHPCAIWTRHSYENFEWLLELTNSLFLEYFHRYGKITHKSFSIFYACSKQKKRLPRETLTAHPKCMPDYCKTSTVVGSYRNYYNLEKSRFAKWQYSKVPTWFKQNAS